MAILLSVRGEESAAVPPENTQQQQDLPSSCLAGGAVAGRQGAGARRRDRRQRRLHRRHQRGGPCAQPRAPAAAKVRLSQGQASRPAFCEFTQFESRQRELYPAQPLQECFRADVSTAVQLCAAICLPLNGKQKRNSTKAVLPVLLLCRRPDAGSIWAECVHFCSDSR